MPPDLEKTIRELSDRQQILDCIHRYCHGMDRLDRELVLSAYHEDAWDDHGTICAPAAEFVDFTMKRHRDYLSHTHHHLTMNHRCELDGDIAHATTYFLYSLTPKSKPGDETPVQVMLCGGRYMDRFERRNGKWAIADRVCLMEWNGNLIATGMPPSSGHAISGVPARDKTDLQYQRPLRVKRIPTTGIA